MAKDSRESTALVHDSGGLVQRAKAEAVKQLWLAVPMVGVSLMQFAIQILSVMFVGHLGELELASASIATSFCTVTGYCVLQGLATGLETLCGQAYGAQQYSSVGLYMYRAFLVLTIIAFPIALLWLNMEQVLIFFHQAPNISSKAGIYSKWLIPGLFAYAFLQPLIKFLQAQSCVLPMFICSTVTLVVHIFFCWILMIKLGMGNEGAALATSVSNWLNVIFIAGVGICTPRCRKCLPKPSSEIFHNSFEFLKIALPSTTMFCLEWWSFEALVLMSGLLPNPELETSVFSIVLNVINFCYMVPYGISAAASTRISNELGTGNASAARFSLHISLVLAALDAILVSSLVLSAGSVVGKAFSSDADVINYVTRVTPILALITVMDVIAGVVSGSARGCGWQTLATVANLGAFYVIGLPLGYFLAFKAEFRGKGLLIGDLCGVSTQAFVLFLIAFNTDWVKQARIADFRVHSSESAVSLLN